MARGGGSRLVTLIALGLSVILVLLFLSTRVRRRARSRPVSLLATYHSLLKPTVVTCLFVWCNKMALSKGTRVVARAPVVARRAGWWQGLTLVRSSARLERFVWDRGCA